MALKVLPAEMARDPQRLMRFRREARAVAALNNPHIVTIFSVEEAEVVGEGVGADPGLRDGPAGPRSNCVAASSRVRFTSSSTYSG